MPPLKHRAAQNSPAGLISSCSPRANVTGTLISLPASLNAQQTLPPRQGVGCAYPHGPVGEKCRKERDRIAPATNSPTVSP